MVGSSLEHNLQQVNKNIELALTTSGRKKTDILVLPISKYQRESKVIDLFNLGLHSFGESYVNEFLQKKISIEKDIDWHFVGRLQTNKVRRLIGEVSLIHSVDKLSLAKEISKRAGLAGVEQSILVQVNIENEESKGGVFVESGPAFLDEVQSLPHLKIQGLMAMPPLATSERESRSTFAKVSNLLKVWRSNLSSEHPFLELSMGTSGDYVNAVKEGATIIRLGTVLFGEREKR